MNPSIVPSFWTATSMSWNQRSFPCAFAVCWSVRHSVHWIGRFSFRASRQHAVSCTCVVILFPNPPPMSWVTKRSLSSGTRSAGPIQIAATPGIWWLQWIVNCPVPRSCSTSAAEHSSGVEEKRSKWSSLILTTRSAAFSAPSTSPQSNTPDQTTFVPASSWRTAASSSCARRASTTTSSGSYSTSTRSAASLASSLVAATTATTGSPMWRTRPTASA